MASPLGGRWYEMQLFLMERGHRPRPGIAEALEGRAALEKRKSLRFDMPGMRAPEHDNAGQNGPFVAARTPLIRVARREADGDAAFRLGALGSRQRHDAAIDWTGPGSRGWARGAAVDPRFAAGRAAGPATGRACAHPRPAGRAAMVCRAGRGAAATDRERPLHDLRTEETLP